MMEPKYAPKQSPEQNSGGQDRQIETGSDEETRDILRDGSASVANDTEGEADTGREPEYYGEKHDPA